MDFSLWSVKEQGVDWTEQQDWHHFIPSGSTLIGTSAFGDLIFLTPMGCIQLLLTETGESTALPSRVTLEIFLNSFLTGEEAQTTLLRRPSLERWYRERGALAHNNVVIFSPYLGLGGNPDGKLSDGMLEPYLQLCGSILGAEVEVTGPEVYLAAGAEVQQIGLWEKAFEYYEKLAKARPVNVAESRLLQAVCLDNLGRPAQAQEFYGQVVSLGSTPDNMAMAHGNMGLNLARSGDLERAEAHFRKALENNPAYSKAYANLSFCLIETGRLKEAEEAARACLEIDPHEISKSFYPIGPRS